MIKLLYSQRVHTRINTQRLTDSDGMTLRTFSKSISNAGPISTQQVVISIRLNVFLYDILIIVVVIVIIRQAAPLIDPLYANLEATPPIGRLLRSIELVAPTTTNLVSLYPKSLTVLPLLVLQVPLCILELIRAVPKLVLSHVEIIEAIPTLIVFGSKIAKTTSYFVVRAPAKTSTQRW